MTLTDFDKQIKDAKDALYPLLVALIDQEQANTDAGIEALTPPVNYTNERRNVEHQLAHLNQLSQNFRFFKMDRRLYEQLIRSANAGEQGTRWIAAYTHTVTELDTIQTIADQYNAHWQDILEFNDLTSSEIAAGTIIEIPKAFNPEEAIFLIQDNPVLDSHVGVKMFGRDLPNSFTVDSTGDLNALSYRETFRQSIQNYVLSELDGNIGYDGLDQDVNFRLLLTRMADIIELDPRIRAVPVSDMEIMEQTGEGVTIKISIIPKNSELLGRESIMQDVETVAP